MVSLIIPPHLIVTCLLLMGLPPHLISAPLLITALITFQTSISSLMGVFLGPLIQLTTMWYVLYLSVSNSWISVCFASQLLDKNNFQPNGLCNDQFPPGTQS